MSARRLPLWTRFRAQERGVAAVEMALVAPVLLLLLMGVTELSLYLSNVHRTSQMSTTVANAIARNEHAQAVHIRAVLDAASTLAGFAEFRDQGAVVISSVRSSGDGRTPLVAWQCRGGGGLDVRSGIGSPNASADLPGGLTLDRDDNVIVTEVFFEHHPFFETDILERRVLRKVAVFRPRLGALTSDPRC